MTASLPRPVILALVGTALFAGLFMFTRSRSSEEPGGTPSATEAQPAPATPPADQTKPDTTTAAPPAATGPGGAGAAAADSKTSGEGLPVAIGRALDAKKVVVLLFWNGNAVDDRSVHQSVGRLPRHGSQVAVFEDGVDDLSRYTRITATAQVNQTPSLVIVDRRGAAEVKTGYLDFQTIKQFVETARSR